MIGIDLRGPRCYSAGMPLPFAARSDAIEPFLAMEVLERALELERAGRTIVHLEVGEPDFSPPPAALEACTRALARGETGYTDSRGLLALREAIAADHLARAGVAIDPERILVTGGTSPAMLLVFGSLIEAGDEVVIGTPHYPCYPNFVRLFGGVPVFVPAPASDGWQLDPACVRRAITPRTRAIVVGSPANPTGAVQDAATLDALANLGVPLLSDEIYGELVYDSAAGASALGRGEQVFVFDGVSKRFAMTGFRLGWVVSPPSASRRLQVMQQNFFISANRFVQHAAIAALREGGPGLVAMRTALAKRRSVLVDGLRALGFGISVPPAGAFYVFADARRFAVDSRALAFDLLDRAGVAITPGIDFGAAGEGFLRFCYAASEASLREALARLAGVLA